jgi:predicted MFS family arabinose efflux permease
LGRYYIWFVVIVAGLAGAIRVLLPRRFAELQQERLRNRPLSRERLKSLLFLAVGAIFGGVYLERWGRQSWVAIGAIFSLLSAAECFFQAQYRSLDALIFQSRLLGIIYLGLAAASYVILSRL